MKDRMHGRRSMLNDKIPGRSAFALAAVMLMLLSPISLASDSDADPVVDATADIPEGRDYLYIITTNGGDDGNVNVKNVQASIDHGELQSVMRVAADSPDASNATTRKANLISQDSSNRNTLNKFWDFDPKTGLGPFNCFYAAINIHDSLDYTEDDATEIRRSAAAGAIAYVLDPYDLTKTLIGNTYTMANYNVMLIIPTVYWKVAYNSSSDVFRLYLSNTDSYEYGGTTVSGMIANAHTSKTDSSTRVHDYIAIAVFEGSYKTVSGKTLLVSQADVSPASNSARGDFSTFAVNNYKAGSGSYLIWNYHHWTLYKMMCYAVMGTKNSQLMIGQGLTGTVAKTNTGAAASYGPYYGTSQYTDPVMMFIENGWGNVGEFLGNAQVHTGGSEYRQLYAGNALGGGTGYQVKIGQVAIANGNNYIHSTAVGTSSWDLSPGKASSSDLSNRLDYPGDKVICREHYANNHIWVGGAYGGWGGAGVAYLRAYDGTGVQGDEIGARTAYFMDDAAFEKQPRYQVRYDLNGVTDDMPVRLCAEAGNSFTVMGSSIEGFNGWNSQPNGSGTDYPIDSVQTITGNMVLYAQWHPVVEIDMAEGLTLMYSVDSSEAVVWTGGPIDDFHFGSDMRFSVTGYDEETQYATVKDNSSPVKRMDGDYLIEDISAYHKLVFRFEDEPEPEPPEPVPPEPDPDDDLPGEDEDDIWDVIRGRQHYSEGDSGRRTLMFSSLAIAAVLLATACCMVSIIRRR